jgi:cytochrome c
MRFLTLSTILGLLYLPRVLPNDMLKAADVNNGQQLMSICLTCHSIVKNEPSKGTNESRKYVGPNLHGVFGRKIASKRDFKYSQALLDKNKEVWTAENLSSYLKNPNRFAPGNMMGYAGVLDPQDRMDIIAYLMTLK